MSNDDDNLALEYDRLQGLVAALDTAIAERDAAKARAVATARAVGAQLDRLGHFARIADEPFDREVARELYWQHPEVHVAEIAKPMNIREGLVASEMGTGTFERPCTNECGRTVQWRLKSRSDAHRQPRLCPDCTAKKEAEREQRRARYSAEVSEEIELLRGVVAEQQEPYARYAEFPGVPGTWKVDENGVPLALRD